MTRLNKATPLLVLAAAAALMVAPAAHASGKASSGTPSTSSPVASTGGGGGFSSKSSNRGGAVDPASPTAPPAPIAPTPALATTPCATLSSVSAPVGYFLTYAALWNDFVINNCADGQETVTVEVIDTNRATGLVEYDVSVAYTVALGQHFNGILDNDITKYDTDYDITYILYDDKGNVLDRQFATAHTMPLR